MIVKNANILAVDDNQVNRTMLCRFLSFLNHHTIEAENGQIALTILQDGFVPDLVLLDLDMPVMGGLKMLTLMKSDPKLRPIPVIMLSGNDEIALVVQCIRSGAEDYLTKPYNPDILEARINPCLERKLALKQNQKLGQYTLLNQIGQGGMSKVYMARHTILRRPTAVKLLRTDAANEKALDYFEQEVQMTSNLTHPNTIIVYDYGTTPEGLFYYAMEYLNGFTLNELVDMYGQLPEARVLHILQQILSSLAEAHGKKLIHRDIKPENIMLCERGGIYDFAKLLDFGIVKPLAEPEPSLDGFEHDKILGSPLYISPESIEEPDKVDARSDLYSLGVVAYYLITGKDLFKKEKLHELLSAHVVECPIPPSKHDGVQISRDFEKIILMCLEKKKKNRPKSAEELKMFLSKCHASGKWSKNKAKKCWIEEKKQLHPEVDKWEDQRRDAPEKNIKIDLSKRISQFIEY